MEKYTSLSYPSPIFIALKMKALRQNLSDFLEIFAFYEAKRLESYEKIFLIRLSQFEKGLFQLARTPYFSKDEIESYIIFLAKIYESLEYKLSPIYKVMMCLFVDMGEKEKAYAAYEKWYQQSLLENTGKINSVNQFLGQYLARFFAFLGHKESAKSYLANMSMISKHIRSNPTEIVVYLSLANYLHDSRLKLILMRQRPTDDLYQSSTLTQFWYGVSLRKGKGYAKKLNYLARVLDERNQNTYYQDYLLDNVL